MCFEDFAVAVQGSGGAAGIEQDHYPEIAVGAAAKLVDPGLVAGPGRTTGGVVHQTGEVETVAIGLAPVASVGETQPGELTAQCEVGGGLAET